MKLEEYEEALKKKEPEAKKQELFKNVISVAIEPLTARGGVSRQLESGHRIVSYVCYANHLDDEEKIKIGNDCVEFVNQIALYATMDKEIIREIEVHLESFVAAYMYRWYPYMRGPAIRCKADPKMYGYIISVYVDNTLVCQIGIDGDALLRRL